MKEAIKDRIRTFFGGFFNSKVTQRTLDRYTYTQIAQICDQALAPNRVNIILGRNERVDSIYLLLNQERSPAPVTAAVLLGLARAGNLESSDVGTVKKITCALSTINQQYRPFCDAIKRSVQATTIMTESNRPDYASGQQLAEIASDSFNAFREHKWGKTRFIPYITPAGQVISSRKQFVSSLRGEDDLAGACIRIAVDLGVLSTQPEKVPSEEREWLRRNIHYVEIVGSSKLNTSLEKFNNLLKS